MTGSVRQALRGIAASPGVAVGKVCLFDRARLPVPRRYVSREDLPLETTRLQHAIEASRKELEEIRVRIGGLTEHRLLLDAQLLMHRDELLVDGAIELLRERSINAEWALSQTTSRIAGRMRLAGEAYLRERADDVQHVGDRILRNLTGASVSMPNLGPDCVLVADDLGPADALLLLRSSACGIAIELGSASSHTAILARSLDIPAVVGVHGLSQVVAEDDLIVVDGFGGSVVVSPDDAEQSRARERGERYRAFRRGLRQRVADNLRTADGVPIKLDANIELPPEAALAGQEGAAGIGLYRTEFLFMDRPEPPSEGEQAKAYCDVVQVMAPRPVVVRTFDIGGDKLHGSGLSECVNPALGVRAIRLGLSRPDLLRTQLRAILRSSPLGDVRVMFPLVSGVDELRGGRALLEQARNELLSEGVEVADVRVGCMIEVPSAVFVADALAAECDFFSVGTNDLVQYTLAADRSNPLVATLASPLHPAVLKLLDLTAKAAKRAGIELAMCGGMAADLVALPLVVGLGFERMSLDLTYLPLVRACVERIDRTRAQAVLAEALRCARICDVRALVIDGFREALREYWEEQSLDMGLD